MNYSYIKADMLLISHDLFIYKGRHTFDIRMNSSYMKADVLLISIADVSSMVAFIYE